MKIYTSYFYMVRFLRPWELPLSTAVWDPKWFHDFKGQNHIYKDRRGVLNGVRAGMFVPDNTCTNQCSGLDKCVTKDPTQCTFLRRYRQQLDKLDAKSFMKYMEQSSSYFQDLLELERPLDFVLIFHEAPTNKCSERWPVQSWFQDNGFEVTEWQKPE